MPESAFRVTGYDYASQKVIAAIFTPPAKYAATFSLLADAVNRPRPVNATVTFGRETTNKSGYFITAIFFEILAQIFFRIPEKL